MSYTLELAFEPAIPRPRILQHFTARSHFTVTNDRVAYENRDTGVYFLITLEATRSLLRQSRIVSAEIDVSYNKPHYFGIEAEIEISALIGEFRPRIHDPQMRGMGDGPYSREGFLRGWNFGNQFAIHVALSKKPDLNIATMPAEKLRAGWAWNYDLTARSAMLRNRRYVPAISLWIIEGRRCLVATWPQGLPISLPKVDYVLVGRVVEGETRFGLASWSEILEIIGRAGFDTSATPLDIEYFATPPAIAQWVANIPLIDLDRSQQLHGPHVMDEETMAAAREFPVVSS